MIEGKDRAVQIHDFNIAIKMLEYTNFEAASDHLISVLSQFPIPIWAYNTSGEVIFWNKEIENFTGIPSKVALEKPDPINVFKQLSDLPTIPMERTFVKVNGKPLTLQVRYFVKTLAEGKLQFWICGSDVTEFRNNEQEMLFRLSKFSNVEKILNHSDSFAYVRENNKDWTISYISSNIYKLGYNTEDFFHSKVTFDQLIHPGDLNRVKSELAQQMHSSQINARLEYRLNTNNDSTIWVSDVLEFIRDSNGNVIQFQGILTNITQHKVQEEKIQLQNTIIQIRNAELYHTNEELLSSYEDLRRTNQKLAESEEKFKIISEQSLLGILIIQNDVFKYVNHAFIKASDYSKEEILNWQNEIYEKLIHPEDAPMVIGGLEQIMKEQTLNEFHIDFRGLTRSGSIRWFSLWSKPITYEGERAILISIMDIDDVKRRQDSLTESENNLRAKLDFILSPEIEIAEFQLMDIYDIAQLQKIQDSFSLAHNVACIITDPQGTPITKPSNFSPVCKMVRSSLKGEELCRKSNKLIGEKARDSLKPISTTCTNCGFIDAGAPIIVGGKHVATWMIGQKLTSPPVANKIAELAKKIEIDQNKLTEAYSLMEVHDNQQFSIILDFLWLLAREISALGYNNIKLAKDIEERKKIEVALRESEELYRQLVQASPDGIALVNRTGTILYASPQNNNIFGFPDETSAIGENILQFIAPEDRESAKLGLLRVIENQETGTQNYTMVKANGQKITVEVNSSAIKDYRGNSKGMISILRDISERKKFEEELINAKNKAEEADRLKSAFLANMSHEIRTPMNGILGFANLLNDEDLTTGERTEYTHIINKNGKLLLQLIDDILDIAKIEAGQLIIREKPSNINQILNEEFTLFKHLIETCNKPNINFLLHIPENHITHKVMLDNARIRQILTNLLSNALKFTDKGSIEFGYVFEDNIIRFFVKDSGIGIPKDKLKIIFDRFRQADETSARKYGGTGLGLTISKNLVKLMNGEMWVESEIGQGSSFYFTIPYKPNDPNGIPIEKGVVPCVEPASVNWKDKCILIAEDENVNFIYLQEILKSTGVKIIHATDGAEAIQICKVTPSINLVLMDIKMPLVSGYTATAEIKKANPNLPIIAQTAYAMEEEKIRCLGAGCDEYVAKPIDRKKLLALIHRFIG